MSIKFIKPLKTYGRFILFTLIILLGVFVYYQYSLQKIPAEVTKSNETISQVDNLRFTFKTSILAQKGVTTYIDAVHTKNTDKYYQAIDYIDAALAFTTISFTANQSYNEKVQLELNEILALMEQNQLERNQALITQILLRLNTVTYVGEEEERQTWHIIQKTYINFKTNEYEILQLYETITIGSFLLISLGIWFGFRQNRLIKENKIQQQALQKLAYIDPLTEIANRKNIESSLQYKINHCQRNHQSFYVALIDIDDFKNINDLMGHAEGDVFLKKIAKGLSHVIRKEDFIGRLGGDEFLIIFNEQTPLENLVPVIERLQEELSKATIINGNEFITSASIGISCYPTDIPANTDSPDQHLIKSADIAMYEAKNQGKNQFHFYDAQLEAKIRHENEMAAEIKKAIELDEFELFYQPQINSKTGKTHAAEALIRWWHPDKGLIMPGAFIEQIEKGCHTTAFGEWVIKHAIQQQQSWQTKGIDIKVSINLSVKYILSSLFYESMLNLIKELKVDLEKVVFEITEYELIQSENNAIEDLKKLQKLGFKFHLDDFGTGYSSLSYLSQLPIESIKIDKSFIDYIQPESKQQNLVDAIIHISDILGKSIIAEGVETEYQVQFLKQAGCEFLQGYYFSKPLSTHDFERYYFEKA